MTTIANPDCGSIAQQLQLILPRLALNGHERDRIADLALDSMDTVEFLCVVHEEFGVRLTESDFHPQQTIGGLLATIARKTSK